MSFCGRISCQWGKKDGMKGGKAPLSVEESLNQKDITDETIA
jgi:hypothetical protein